MEAFSREDDREYDVAIVVTKCPERGVDIVRLVADYIRKGYYKFLLDLRGPGFTECIELVRRLTQEFISASFTVVEYGETRARNTITI